MNHMIQRQAIFFAAVLSTVAFSDEPKSEPPAPRTDLYGDPLPAGALARFGTVRWRLDGGVHSMAISPDGKSIAVGSNSSGANFVWVVDATTGQRKQTLSCGQVSVTQVGFSPDGKWLAAAQGLQGGGVRVWETAQWEEKSSLNGVYGFAFSPDGKVLALVDESKILFWDHVEQKEVSQLKPPSQPYYTLAFSPDGKRLASTNWQGEILLWDVEAKKILRELKGHTKRVASMSFTPDGKTLGSAGADFEQTIFLWDVESGKQKLKLEHVGARAGMQPPPLVFAPDGKQLASVDEQNNRVGLWDVATGQKGREFSESRGWDFPSCLVLSPDGKTLAAGGGDNMIRLWDLATDKLLHPPNGHEGSISQIGFLRDDKRLFTYGSDAKACVWDLATSKELFLLDAEGGFPSFAKAEDILVTGTEAAPKNTARLYDLDNGKVIRVLPYEGWLVWHAEISDDGKLLAVSEQDDNGVGRLRLLDLQAAKESIILGDQKALIWGIKFSPDGKLLAVSCRQEAIHLFDTATGREIFKLPNDQEYNAPHFSPDGKFLALHVWSSNLSLWEVGATAPREKPFAQWEQVESFAFSPDSRRIAIGRKKGDIEIWDVAANCLLLELRGHTDRSEISFTPDGNTLVSASWDRSVRVWDLLSGGQIFQFDVPASALAISPDGRLLATGLWNTTALVWDLTGLAWEGEAKAADLSKAWDDLASTDAAKAYRAIWRLSDAKQAAVELIRSRLNPVTVDEKKILSLITDLDHRDFAVRERASAELVKIGAVAEPSLQKALRENPAAEVKDRVAKLLPLVAIVREPELLRRLRAIQVLERIGTKEAVEVLQTLAQGAPLARETQEAKAALERIKQRPQDGAK